MADIHRIGLTRSNSEIWGSSKYSDLTVRCGSQDFKLHRAIVCPRSTFFAAACDGQFHVHKISIRQLTSCESVLTSLFQEAQTCTIVLKEDDPPTVRRMLTYLYTLTYDDEGDAASAEHYMVNGAKISKAAPTLSPPLSEEELSRHAKMMNNVVVYAVAQKYDISELKELATFKFRQLLWLKAPSPSLLHVVDAVFETTSIADSGLRSVVAKYCIKYRTEIVADNHLSTMIRDHGDLGLDILRQDKVELTKTTLATLKGKLAQMTSEAFNIPSAKGYVSSMARLRQDLKAAYDSIPDKD